MRPTSLQIAAFVDGTNGSVSLGGLGAIWSFSCSNPSLSFPIKAPIYTKAWHPNIHQAAVAPIPRYLLTASEEAASAYFSHLPGKTGIHGAEWHRPGFSLCQFLEFVAHAWQRPSVSSRIPRSGWLSLCNRVMGLIVPEGRV